MLQLEKVHQQNNLLQKLLHQKEEKEAQVSWLHMKAICLYLLQE